MILLPFLLALSVNGYADESHLQRDAPAPAPVLETGPTRGVDEKSSAPVVGEADDPGSRDNALRVRAYPESSSDDALFEDSLTPKAPEVVESAKNSLGDLTQNPASPVSTTLSSRRNLKTD